MAEILAYVHKDGFFHRLHPFTKIVFIIAISMMCIISTSMLFLVALLLPCSSSRTRATSTAR